MKLTKRQRATLSRDAAKVLERDGWSLGALHRNKDDGQIVFQFDVRNLNGQHLVDKLQRCTHCAAGAINLAALESGASNEVGYALRERDLLAEAEVLVNTEVSADMTRTMNLIRDSLNEAMSKPEKLRDCRDFIVTYNDTVVAAMPEAGKAAASFLRKVARHLEHGGGQ